MISDGTDTRTIAVGDAQVTISGSTVTINPTADLNSGSSYYVQLASGVINDLTGNAYAGISDITTLNFSTPVADVIAPTLSSSTPADDATAIAIGDNIVLTFSESVAAGSGDIIINDGAGDLRTIPVGDAQVSISGNTVTINPTADLNGSANYYVQLNSGVINDTSGNPYAGINNTTTLNFTTAAAVTPLSTVTSAADEAGANAYLASGDVTLTIDFASNNYTGANFDLSSFGAGDKLRIAVADGNIQKTKNEVGGDDKNMVAWQIYAQNKPVRTSDFEQDFIVYTGTAGALKLKSNTFTSSNGSTINKQTLTITGLPAGLASTNFEFF